MVALNLGRNKLDTFPDHLLDTDLEKSQPLNKLILQNQNSSFAIVFVTIPVSIGLTNNLLTYIQGSDQYIPSIAGIFTSIVAFFFSFMVSGNLNTFKSFSIIQAFIIANIVSKYGINALPWIGLLMGVFILIGSQLKIHCFVTLIPKSVTTFLIQAIGMLIVLKELTFTLGFEGVFQNVDLAFFSKIYSSGLYMKIDPIETILYVFFTTMLVLCQKNYSKWPWFLIFSLVSIFLGWILKVNNPNVQVLGDRFHALQSLEYFYRNPLSHLTGFANFFMVVPKGRFLMDVLLYTALTIQESTLTQKSLKVLSIEKNGKSKKSHKGREIFTLGWMNIIMSFLGLFPLSIPFARNVFVAKIGTNHRIFHIFSGTQVFLFTFTFWPVMKFFPLLSISIFNTTLGIMICDFQLFFMYMLYAPSLFYQMILCLCGCQFVDILYCTAFLMLFYYLIYMRFGSKSSFHLKRNMERFFYKILKTHTHIQIKNELDITDIFNDDESKPILSVSHQNHFENYFSVEDEINNLKTCFFENGVIYVLEGTFNFYRHKQHIENIKALGKSHICVDFKNIWRHDIDFQDEYQKMFDKLDEIGLNVYITGFSGIDIECNGLLSRVQWIQSKNRQAHILYKTYDGKSQTEACERLLKK